MVDALVEHDYIAKSPSELTIKKGDIIREVTRKHEGWCEGVLREKRGLFPDTSVRMLDREPAVVYRSRKDGSRMRRCKVVFSYKQDHEDELNLNVGDVIEVLGEEEEGWWRGLLNGREGVFPSNFVVEIPGGGSRESLKDLEDDKSPVLPPKPAKLQCQVKFDYKAENSDELTIKEGDIITVLTQEGTDPGWWFGELNGRMGVFPDNFVVLLPLTAQEEKKTTKEQQSGARPTSVAQQRKSLEVKTEKIENESSALKTTPPLPSKKPLLPVKKSPSGSSSTGLFSGIKKKFTDAVDGGSVSKSSKIESKVDTSTSEASADNAFDQVERRPLLSDVRATRAKAPGRRPPSVVYKEGEPGVMNGNMEHPQPTNLDTLSEKLGNSNSSIDQDTTTPEQKPKLREWEKHKAPWLAEMKLNQAKRTSTSPGPEQNKPKLQNSDGVNLKLTLTNDKTDTPDEVKKEQSPVDTQKHTNFGGRLKTPPADSEKHTSSVVLRQKPAAPAAPVRPQTIQNVNDVQHAKQQPQTPTKLPLPGLAKTPSPVTKPVATEKINECGGGDAAVNQEQPVVSYKQYAELLERIQKLESLVEKQFSAHTTAIENLKGRLQVETDLRIMLQAKLDEVVQCVMQV